LGVLAQHFYIQVHGLERALSSSLLAEPLDKGWLETFVVENTFFHPDVFLDSDIVFLVPAPELSATETFWHISLTISLM
jgi:hypothetical protein